LTTAGIAIYLAQQVFTSIDFIGLCKRTKFLTHSEGCITQQSLSRTGEIVMEKKLWLSSKRNND
jgi:hypothetical protein